MADRAAELRSELSEVSKAAAVRTSVDAYARASIEFFLWATLSGVCGKLLYDSARPPYAWYPLVLLDLLLIVDVFACYTRAKRLAAAEAHVQARMETLRRELQLDEPWSGGAAGTQP